jgi:hypothetical protein
MPEFTGDYRSAETSVKNNIMKGIAGFTKEMSRFVRIDSCVDRRNNGALRSCLRLALSWKVLERTEDIKTISFAFMAIYDGAAACSGQFDSACREPKTQLKPIQIVTAFCAVTHSSASACKLRPPRTHATRDVAAARRQRGSDKQAANP